MAMGMKTTIRSHGWRYAGCAAMVLVNAGWFAPLHAQETAPAHAQAADAAPSTATSSSGVGGGLGGGGLGGGGLGGSGSSASPLQLDTTTIKAAPGLPRVLYIVPWKRAQPGDTPGRPQSSLVDEMIAPVDRTEFRRELRYSADLAKPATADAAKH